MSIGGWWGLGGSAQDVWDSLRKSACQKGAETGIPLDAQIAFDKPLPSPYYHIHRRSFLGVLLPTILKELPHLGGQSDFLGVSRHLRSTSPQDPEHHRFILLFSERDLAGENFHGEHRKGEHVSGF